MKKKLVFVTALLIIVNTSITLIAEDNIRQQFETKYQVWKKYISRSEIMVQSIAGPRFECQQFQEIVKLGLPILPYIVRKIEQDPNEQFLWKAIEEIAKIKIRGEYDKEKKLVVFPDFPNLKPGENVYLYWWKEGRKKTPQKFNELYKEWENLKTQGNDEGAKDKYQRIKDLGIVALPYLIEKIEQGETDLIPIVSYLTDGSANEKAGPAGCVNWWRENKEKWTLPE